MNLVRTKYATVTDTKNGKQIMFITYYLELAFRGDSHVTWKWHTHIHNKYLYDYELIV